MTNAEKFKKDFGIYATELWVKPEPEFLGWLNAEATPFKIGKWKELKGSYMTPGGTPIYICGQCGGSEHLHGVEYSRRKIFCDECGSVNIYPWEKSYEEIGQ